MPLLMFSYQFITQHPGLLLVLGWVSGGAYLEEHLSGASIALHWLLVIGFWFNFIVISQLSASTSRGFIMNFSKG